MGVQDGAVSSQFLDPDRSLRYLDQGYRPKVGVGNWNRSPVPMGLGP